MLVLVVPFRSTVFWKNTLSKIDHVSVFDSSMSNDLFRDIKRTSTEPQHSS